MINFNDHLLVWTNNIDKSTDDLSIAILIL